MASLIKTVSGEHLPSSYVVCGVFRPKLLTTRPPQVGCLRCMSGRSFAAAKQSIREAPEAARFEVTKREDLNFASSAG